MSQAVTYLELDDLLAAIHAIHEGAPPVRDWGLLESALARPQATVFGEDAYPGIHSKAAALLSSIVGNHALVDGNKRLGVVATYLFYGLNDWSLRPASDDQLFNLVIEVASQRLVDVIEIAARLEELAVPRP